MARYKEITLKSNRVNAGTTGAKSQIYKEIGRAHV